jgi:hypothetical protein
MTTEKSAYLRALEVMADELEYPNRDLRLAAQVMNCKAEVYQICEWLRAEIQAAIFAETMFDDEGTVSPTSEDGLPPFVGDEKEL